MKKKYIITLIFCLISALCYSQNTVILPNGTDLKSPVSHRTLGTDTLHQTWLNFPGLGYNRYYSATELNKLFRIKSIANALSRNYTDSTNSKLLPIGLQGQIMKAIADNSNQYASYDALGIGAYIISELELEEAKTRFTQQSEIFNTWKRFAHGGTPGSQILNNIIPSIPLLTNSWAYDSVINQINSTVNSEGHIGFICKKAYSHFTNTATISANGIGTTEDAAHGYDNDVVTMIMAYVEDQNDKVTNNAYGLNSEDFNWPIDVTNNLVSNQHTLTLVRGRETTLEYCVFYDFRKSTQKLIATITPSFAPNTNWAGASVDLKVVRDGDIFKVYTSEFSDAPGGKGSLGYELIINLDSNPVLYKFKGAAQYGFGAYSQANASYSDLTFSQTENVIYDLRNGDVWVADNAGIYSIASGRNVFTETPPRSFLYNDKTNRLLWLKDDHSYIQLNQDSTTIADNYIHKTGNITETITGKKKLDTVIIHRLRLDSSYNDTIGFRSRIVAGTTIYNGGIAVKIYMQQQNNCAKFYERLNNGLTVNIACYGTSITYGLNISGSFASINGQAFNRSAYNAPTMLDSILKKRSGVMIDTVYNRGVSSGTSSNGWDRWKGASATNVAFVEYGINEATGTTSVAGYRTDLTRFATRLINQGTWVIFVLPTYTTTPTANYYIREYGNMMREVGFELGIPVFDAGKQINYLGNNAIQSDGTHLTDAAYTAIGEGMAAFILQSDRYTAEANRFYSALSFMAMNGSITNSGTPASTGWTIGLNTSGINSKNTFAFYLKDPADIYATVVPTTSALNVIKWSTGTTTVFDNTGPSGSPRTVFLFRLYPGHHVINVENVTKNNIVRFDNFEFKSISTDNTLQMTSGNTNTTTTGRIMGINLSNANIWTAAQTFSTATFPVMLDRSVGNAVGLTWQRAALRRWDMLMTSTSESGSNAGSDFQFRANNDAGSALGDVWTANRATQVMTFAKNPIFTSGTANRMIWLDANKGLTTSAPYTGSASLDFTSTPAQTSSELTINVTGASDGDIVILGVPNVSSNANSCYTARVSATNIVTVKFNNYSSGSIDPASGTFKATVIK